jgi:hypothetical protein
VVSFDKDSVNLYLDICITKALTSFKSDFIEDLFIKENLGTIATTTNLAAITTYSITHCIITDSMDKIYLLKIAMNCTIDYSFNLVLP